jgi:ATP-binding cassette subfamily F protein 2
MEAAGLVEMVQKERQFVFAFEDPHPIPNPILIFDSVAFSYPVENSPQLYNKVSFGIHLDSRIALVGPNGAGKSTLLKLMVGDLTPTSGRVDRNPHLIFGRYHQHSTDQLDLTMTPLDFLKSSFPQLKQEDEQWRAILGSYGINGSMQLTPMIQMSDGQKSRFVFAIIRLKLPHLLLFDEPTNHLDMESIDALAEAINDFQGGMILVSHDFRLISQVAKEIWICENKTITPFKGDITQYKEMLKKQLK